MKKALLLILSFVLAVSIFAGCNSSNTQVSSQESPQQESPDKDVSVSDEAKASWERDTSPIELEWFVAYDWAAVTFDAKNNTLDRYINDNTGVTIKFSVGSQEKLNMLIATNSLPDMVTYDAISVERLAMENGGHLLPLDELKDEYAPDMQVPQGMIDWYRNENDGHWYIWVSYFYDIADAYARGAYLPSHNMNFARTDIMNQLGIDPATLQTKEGFIEALRKVKDANVQYDGKKVIPYIGDDVELLAEQMGADREDSSGNLLNIRRQPEYLEALLFLNQIYNEGLTTDEIFTMDTTLRQQMVASGEIFSGTRMNYLNGKDTLFYNDSNALMQGVGLIKGNSGKEAIVSPSPTAGWAATMITKNCKEPARAASLLSFLTTKEISLSYWYGGIDGYDIVDGQAIIKQERVDERSADTDAFNAKYRSTLQDLICDYIWVLAYEPKTGLNALQEDYMHYQNTWIDGHLFDDKIFNDVSPEGGSDLAGIAAQLEAYWEQQFSQIVMAATPEKATEIYDGTIAQMDAMGMTELDNYKNGRFQKNKEKMDVEFAWPRNQK